MSDQDTQTPATTETEVQPQLALERIYIKDMSFEVPSGAAVFTQPWEPAYDINLSSSAEQLDPEHFQVVLSITVNAKNKDATAFVAEVHQAGIFLIQGIPQEQLAHILGAYCPNILFPFVREAINEMVCKGSFPQLLLAPINFDAAFEDNLARQQIEQEANAPTGNA